MATNDFLPYAVGGGANVLSQSAYAALTTLLANGLSSGIVPSNQLNKTLRQPSIMAAVIGQLIADATGQNAVDDGTVTTLEKNLAAVIRGAAAYATDTGSANAYAISLSPAPASLVAGMEVRFLAANSNTGASTLTVNGTSKSLTKNGSSALGAGDILSGSIVSARYDGTQFQLTPAVIPTTLLSSNGYIKLPGGLIVQWGLVGAISANSSLNITYPIAFPNNFFSVVATAGSAGSATPMICGLNSSGTGNSKAGFTAWNSSTTAATLVGCYVVIGN